MTRFGLKGRKEAQKPGGEGAVERAAQTGALVSGNMLLLRSHSPRRTNTQVFFPLCLFRLLCCD